MSTICGKYTKSFRDANTVVLNDISLDSDPDFFWLKIVTANKSSVTCEAVSSRTRQKVTLKKRISVDESGQEYVTISVVDTYCQIFRHGEPMRYKALPFINTEP
jgi:hypothetical protein